jgi:hypothetical protein
LKRKGINTQKRKMCMPMAKAYPLMKKKKPHNILYMSINKLYDDETSNHEYSSEEGDINLEDELIFALSELKRLKKKNQTLKEQLRKSKGEYHEPTNETETISLKRQLEEEKRAAKIFANKLIEMEDICHKTKLEIFYLRKELDKKVTQLNTNMSFEKRSIVLEDILNVQRLPFDRLIEFILSIIIEKY